jgi:hypothetical protein
MSTISPHPIFIVREGFFFHFQGAAQTVKERGRAAVGGLGGVQQSVGSGHRHRDTQADRDGKPSQVHQYLERGAFWWKFFSLKLGKSGQNIAGWSWNFRWVKI